MSRISQCVQVLVQSREMVQFLSVTEVASALSSIIDEASFGSVRREAGIIVPGFGGGSYDEFRQSARRHFSNTQFSWSRRDAVSFLHSRIPPEAYHAFSQCLNSSQLGFEVEIEAVTPSAVTVRLNQRSPGNASASVDRSFISGGRVVSPAGVPAGALMPEEFEFRDEAEHVVQIERNENAPLRFSLEANPYSFTEYVPAPIQVKTCTVESLYFLGSRSGAIDLDLTLEIGDRHFESRQLTGPFPQGVVVQYSPTPTLRLSPDGRFGMTVVMHAGARRQPIGSRSGGFTDVTADPMSPREFQFTDAGSVSWQGALGINFVGVNTTVVP